MVQHQISRVSGRWMLLILLPEVGKEEMIITQMTVDSLQGVEVLLG
jgi:hypothetical protein